MTTSSRRWIQLAAAICLVRALLLPPLAMSRPELRNAFEAVAVIVLGLAGIGFALGVTAARRPGLY